MQKFYLPSFFPSFFYFPSEIVTIKIFKRRIEIDLSFWSGGDGGVQNLLCRSSTGFYVHVFYSGMLNIDTLIINYEMNNLKDSRLIFLIFLKQLCSFV